MTVKRQKQGEFHTPTELVVEAIRTVLAKGGSSYKYRQTSYDSSTRTFRTVITPSLYPLILPTPMTITVLPSEMGTKVVVGTRSQWFVLGDVFNFYSRYITAFLNALTQNLMPTQATQ